MGDNRDRVFVEVRYNISNTKRDPTFEWLLNHFDRDKTKIVPIPYYGNGYVRNFKDESERYLHSRCAQEKFGVEILVCDALGNNDDTSTIRELITEHGMNKFVTHSYDDMRRAISEVFNVAPNFTCKIWFIDIQKEKLISTRWYNPSHADMMEDAFEENKKLKKRIKDETRRHEEVINLLKKVNGELRSKLSSNDTGGLRVLVEVTAFLTAVTGFLVAAHATSYVAAFAIVIIIAFVLLQYRNSRV